MQKWCWESAKNENESKAGALRPRVPKKQDYWRSLTFERLGKRKLERKLHQQEPLLRKCCKRVWKGSKREPRGAEREPRGDQMEPKRNQGAPKAARRELKRTQGAPKGSKREPKGAKREPRGDQKASKNPLGRQGRFWERKGGVPPRVFGSHFGTIFNQKVDQNRCKKRCQKNMIFHKKNDPKNVPKSIKNIWKSNLFAKGCFRQIHDYSWTVCSKPWLGTFKKHQKWSTHI